MSPEPSRSGIPISHLDLANPKVDYPAIRRGVLNVIQNSHLDQIIKATYSHLIVDEYQDCQPDQHQLIVSLSNLLPTCALGDPLQSIFGFTTEGTVSWVDDVLTTFPPAGTLSTPWRWNLVGNETLGLWLLAIREELLKGRQIDLRQAPNCVEWICLDGLDDWPKQLKAANTPSPNPGGGSLIMAKWPKEQADFARSIPGASKVETADMSELQIFAASFVPSSNNALGQLVTFASSVMTGVSAPELQKRLQSIDAGTNRTPPNDIEHAIIGFREQPNFKEAAVVLSQFSRDVGAKVFRPELLRTAIKTLNSAEASDGRALADLAISIRDQARFSGRQIPRKAVGSTLLFKGLEADVSIILKAEGMDARDLYVALTRGSRKVVVCSKTPLLPT
ncbi:MAG: UvrD-helicase domain-containing protein [Pontixanthobacter sp.]